MSKVNVYKKMAVALRKQFYQPIFDIDNGVHVHLDAGRYIAAIKSAIMAVDLRIEAYMSPPNGAIDWAENKADYWEHVKKELENQLITFRHKQRIK